MSQGLKHTIAVAAYLSICFLSPHVHGEEFRLSRPSMRIPGSATTGLCFSANGRMLLIGSTSDVRIWDLGNGEEPAASFQFAQKIIDADLSPDGNLALVAVGTSVQVWSVKTKKMTFKLGELKDLHRAKFIKDGKQLLTTAADLRIWSAEDGKLIAAIPCREPVYATASEDGRIVAVTTREKPNGLAHVWDATRGKITGAIDEANFSKFLRLSAPVSVSADGQYVLTLSFHNVNVWDSNAREIALSVPIWREGEIGPLNSVAMSPSNREFAVAGCGAVRIVRIDKGEKVGKDLISNAGTVTAAFYSNDGRRLIASSEGVVWVWDVKTSAQLREIIPIDVRAVNDLPMIAVNANGTAAATSWNADRCTVISDIPDR